jgi:hypothetical protein
MSRSMTAPPSMLSPSSILPRLRLTVVSFPQGKIRRAFQKLLFKFFYRFKLHVAEVDDWLHGGLIT